MQEKIKDLNQVPFSEDAELAVIGSMLSSKEAVSKSIQWLNSEFFYKDAHSKIFSVMIGLFATVFFINQGPMLLEGNGSVRAQLVYNIGHTIVSILALTLSLIITLGILFSTITHSSSKISNTSFFEEE